MGTKKKQKSLDSSFTWEDAKKKAFGFLMLVCLMVFFLYLQATFIPSPMIPGTSLSDTFEKNFPSEVVFRDADVIFQRSSGELADRIASVTGSELTHCGLIVVEGDSVLVLEAGSSVVLTSVELWVQSGRDSRFALLRDESLTAEERRGVLEAGKVYLGRPYDFQYEWDDEKLYCSELVYKAYLKGSGRKTADFIQLGKLSYKGHEDFIRKLMGGVVPLDREMITPDSLYRNEKFLRVYDDFR